MALVIDHLVKDFDPRFKIFHELMANKVREILLISTPYDAWIMEEDVRLSERIIHEYRGLNLSNPPRLTWVASISEATAALEKKKFDMVITMPRILDMNCLEIGKEVKKRVPDLPVVLFAHSDISSVEFIPGQKKPAGIDRVFVWSGNTDILVALIKSAEDKMNVNRDAESAGIRVILFVEDSPYYISSLLPILYKELVSQTQAIMEEGLNEEHRLLTMRARPKILIAETYEEAVALYDQFKPNILGVISDVRFPRQGSLDANAGVNLLEMIKKDRWDIPLLLTSSEGSNAKRAQEIQATFVNKNSPSLHAEVHDFFLEHLGFGDFVFKMPDGRELGRASNLRSLEKMLGEVPSESLILHASRNDFSRWLFARTEIILASTLRPATAADFSFDIDQVRSFLVDNIRERRRRRQKGVVVNFDALDFDTDTEFFKIGKGSLGGKARGLAFASNLLKHHMDLNDKFKDVDIAVPQSLVITTEGFESFIQENDLKQFSNSDSTDDAIAEAFLKAKVPIWLKMDLEAYLKQVEYPLAVRSSSLLEDAQFRAYAGLYRTYMLSNDCPSFEKRLEHLLTAVKLVYASTYFQGAKAFSKRVGHRTEEEKMAVIIQKLIGEKYNDFYYPAISGVSQSHNYYPFSHMKPEEGIATIALGLGKMVVEGEKTLRFSPRYPQLLPQRSTVEDILQNSQRFFYTIRLEKGCRLLGVNDSANLDKRELSDAESEFPVQFLCSTYVPEEHRIRDTSHIPGHRVLTFAQVLKYNAFPLADIIFEIMAIGEEGMGCPVELEFSVNFPQKKDAAPQFALLQMRPMTARAELTTVTVTDEDIKQAFCFSDNALGNAIKKNIIDLVYIKPAAFDPAKTMEIAREIGMINKTMMQQNHKYVLIGPGRWGSADRWLGIPVEWADICNVDAIVETAFEHFKAEPSQGSHFFHNITTMGINYLSVSTDKKGFVDWDWITALPVAEEYNYVAHARLEKPITIKVDGRKLTGVMVAET